MLILTKDAADKVRTLLKNQNKDPGFGLRVFIESGGCAGFQYGFDLDQKTDMDHIIECHGIQVFLDRKSSLFLFGCEIDYKETMMASGFTVKNPNAESSCGCGTSFSM